MNNEVFLRERIQVIAVFDESVHRLRPLRFKRSSGQVVDIQKVGLRYPAPEGRKTIHIYNVTDGQSEYQLELDSEQLVWKLTREAIYV